MSYFGIQPSRERTAQNRVAYTAGAGQTVFAAVCVPPNVDVYQNGVKLAYGVDFTATTSAITLVAGATLGDNVEIDSITSAAPYNIYTQPQVDALIGNYYAIATGTSDALSVTTTPLIPALVNGVEVRVRVGSSNATGTPSITFANLGVSKTITSFGNSPVAANAWSPNQEVTFRYNQTTDKMEFLQAQFYNPPVRQTVLSGPVDATGTAAFGGSTGSTSVTLASTTLTVTAAFGNTNRTGTLVNPTWTIPTTTGTYVLYADVSAAGVATVVTGAVNLFPIYQKGGTYSTTTDQHTFNWTDFRMTVGAAGVATQVYRVAIGEVDVSGSVTTAIRWYAMMGDYEGTLSAYPASGSPQSKNHNLGLVPRNWKILIRFTSAAHGYSIGDEVDVFGLQSGSNAPVITCMVNRLAMQTVANAGSPNIYNTPNGSSVALTTAAVIMVFRASRGW